MRASDVASRLRRSSVLGTLVYLGACRVRERLIPPAERLKFFFLQLFEIEEHVVGSLGGTDELVESHELADGRFDRTLGVDPLALDVVADLNWLSKVR